MFNVTEYVQQSIVNSEYNRYSVSTQDSVSMYTSLEFAY